MVSIFDGQLRSPDGQTLYLTAVNLCKNRLKVLKT